MGDFQVNWPQWHRQPRTGERPGQFHYTVDSFYALSVYCVYCKKLNSLKHLVSATVAELHN